MKRRTVLAVLLAAVPLAPIAAAVLLGSGSATATAQRQPFAPVPPARTTPVRGGAHVGAGHLVARLLHRSPLLVAPGGRPLGTLSTATKFGSPTYLWVVDARPGWLGVVSPVAGNGRVGWLPASAATLLRDPWEIRVSLHAHALTVLDGRRTLARYPVAIGRPSAPTPTGRFAVTDRLTTDDATGPYGCCILALSATSPHPIEGWGGGNRIAIHSTPDTGSIGYSVSHGCVRVDLADGRWLLDHIPLGTPAIISS